MATLLYRLGRFSARRAWLVIVAWLAILALAGGAFALFGGTLTSAISVPGTATQKVSEELFDKFPAASGGRGTVVFTTSDDSPFTAEQRAAIGDLLTVAGDFDEVKATTNPFDTQLHFDGRADEIAGGRQQIADAAAQLDAGQAQLDAAQAEVTDGQAQLDVVKAQAEAAGQLAAVQARFDAQQARIDTSAEELAIQQTVIDDGRDELEAQTVELEKGSDLIDLASAIRQVSTDGTTAVAGIQFDEPLSKVPAEAKEAIVDAMESADIDGVNVEVANDIAASIPELLGPGEIGGVIFAAVVLLVMLGTLIGASLPLINAIIGVAVGSLASLALSGTVTMLSVTPVLGVMLGLAVGIDYSLFILNRHRTQLKNGVPLHESIGLANGTSGNAVVFAGSTVLIALLALNLTGIPFLGLMGTVAAVCVLAAILIAITLTPAVLRLAGTKILTKKARSRIGTDENKAGVSSRPMNTLRAVVTVSAGTALLLIIAIPALDMRLGLPRRIGRSPSDSSAYQAYKLVDDKFGPGVERAAHRRRRPRHGRHRRDRCMAEQVRIGTHR